MFGLFLALCAFAAPVQADVVCDQPITLTVALSDEFEPATQDALANGGTLRYDVTVSGTGDEAVGKGFKVTLDFVIQVITAQGGLSPSTFTRPRAQVNVSSPGRAVVKDNGECGILVGAVRSGSGLHDPGYAHPAG